MNRIAGHLLAIAVAIAATQAQGMPGTGGALGGNLLNVDLSGDANLMQISQVAPSGMEGNSLDVSLDGNSNGGTGTGPLGLPFGTLTQTGSRNEMQLTVTGSGNFFAMLQRGMGNSVAGRIVGQGNEVSVMQIGTGNYASFSQIGQGNRIVISQ